MSVTVYSTSTCPWCIMAKNYLKSRNISFVDKNVSADRSAAEEMIRKSGQRGVPVIDINGKAIVGFNQAEIDRLIPKK